MRNPFRRKSQPQNEWEPVSQPELHPELADQLHELTGQWGSPDDYEKYSQATYNILVSAFQAHVRSLVAEGERLDSAAIGSVLAGLSDYQYDASLWNKGDYQSPRVRPKYTETMPLLRGALGYPEPRSKPSLANSRRPPGNLSPETRRRTGKTHVSELTDDTTGYNPLIGSGYVSGTMGYTPDPEPTRSEPTPTPTYEAPSSSSSDFGGGAGGYASGGDSGYSSGSSSYDSGSTSY